MARNNYPGAKTEAGIVCALNCNAPCGGWVVLYDRNKGAQLGITEPISTTGRYILVHRPSQNCLWPFDDLKQAREFTRAAAKGEDATGGLLPRSTKPTKAEKAAAEFVTEVKCAAKATGARHATAEPPPTPQDGNQEPETGNREPTPDFHLEFKREMLSKFTPSIIVQKLDDLLNAMKPVSLQNLDSGERETVDVPDWMAREKGIRFVVEMNEGKAKERPDTKEPVKRSWEDMDKMLRNSPKARAFMRQHLNTLEAKQPDANSAAKTKA